MYMAGMVFLPPGVVLPFGISLVQNYGKYPRLHHLSMTEIFFLLSKQKKFAKTFGGFMESMYLCTRNQANASIAQLVRAPDC